MEYLEVRQELNCSKSKEAKGSVHIMKFNGQIVTDARMCGVFLINAPKVTDEDNKS